MAVRLTNVVQVRLDDVAGWEPHLGWRKVYLAQPFCFRLGPQQPVGRGDHVLVIRNRRRGHVQHSVDQLVTVAVVRQGVEFLDTPDTYFDVIDQRIPNHGEDVERLRKNKILIDADPETKQRKLLQIFTQNAIGPIFFEIIQRKGNEGFGEGNFKALFESIELDQIRRGVIEAE